MCGITGVVRLEAQPDDEARVRAMTDALRHRGPDGDGVAQIGLATLGHRRLAILDLSERGRQPMLAARGQVGLSYNGEVYNHRELRADLEARGHAFESQTDTEVVLRAYLEWGPDAVARLNGMFGFAVWDQRERRLLLARDHYGQKPLYYAELEGGGLAFASEVRAIASYLRAEGQLSVSPRAVAKYLCFDGFPSGESVYAQVRKLPPGCLLEWSEASPKPRIRRYWTRAYQSAERSPSPSQAADELWEQLCRAVDRHLMSDVPLGVFLSGGIDSSAILAAMVSRIDPGRVRAFSIGFQEASYDESAAARQVANYLGVEHRVQTLDESVLLRLLPEILDHLDEPLADASVVPTYALSRFARQEVTVALGGDGGDELLAGYDTTIAERAARAYLRFPSLARRALARGVSLLPPSSDKRSLQFRASRFVRGLVPDPLERNQRWFGSFLPEEAASLVTGSGDPAALYEDLHALHPPPGEQAALELWTAIYLPDCVLTKVDRASMAVSLEVRAPFLDREFARYVTSLPYEYKLRGLTRKWILKRAMAGRLPRAILERSKQGFGVPCGEWLRGPLREEAEELFSPAQLSRFGLLDPEPITRLFREHLSRRFDHRKQLWALYVLLRWHARSERGS